MSTLTTAWNAQAHLGDAIASLRHQSLEAIQIVIVIDGARDDSAEIADSLAAHDARIEVLHLDHVGRSRALNAGMAACRAPYVAILDADDLAHPRRLEVSLEALEASPSNFAGLGAAMIDFVGSGTKLPDLEGVPPFSCTDVTAALRRFNPLRHSSMLLRAEAVRAVGGYDETLRRQVDYDLYIRLVAAGLHIGRLEVALGGMRQHEGQSYLAGGPRAHAAYRFSSLRTQARALRAIDGPLTDLAYLPARAGYLTIRTLAPRLFAGRAAHDTRVVELPE